MFSHLRAIRHGSLLAAMKKPEKPYMVLDGEDAFPDFANPEWRKQMMAKAKKRAALHPKPEKSQQPEEPRHASSADR